MRINDLNEIMKNYDFYESIIDEILYDNYFNVKIKVFYFWKNDNIKDPENVIIGFENCYEINISMGKAITGCKIDNIVRPHIEINSFEVMKKNNLIHVIIKNHYGDIMFDIVCDNLYIEV